MILHEGTSDELEAVKGEIWDALKKKWPTRPFKIFPYQLDFPEDVTFHLGKMVRYVAKPEQNGSDESQSMDEESLTFRQQVGEFWEQAKPHLKQLGKEIWYSKKQLADLEVGKKPEGRIGMKASRISSDSSRLKEENVGKTEDSENNLA